jgi:hypothetical protein
VKIGKCENVEMNATPGFRCFGDILVGGVVETFWSLSGVEGHATSLLVHLATSLSVQFAIPQPRQGLNINSPRFKPGVMECREMRRPRAIAVGTGHAWIGRKDQILQDATREGCLSFSLIFG